MADRTPARRALGAQHLAIELGSSDLDEREREVLERLLRKGASDPERIVRMALATRLCRSRSLLREVALIFADDVLSVAQPVLEKSPALLDEDLARILAECDGRKQVCVARRQSLSIAVSAAVVASGNAAAVVALLENGSACVDEALLNRVFDRYGRFKTVKAAMVRRGDLPASVRARLPKASPVAPGMAQPDETMSPPARAQTSPLLADAHSTASAVLQALCKGDISFVEDAMAELAGLSAEKAALLIHDASPFGLKAIYRQCRFPDALYPAFRVAVDMVQRCDLDADPEGARVFTDTVVERILEKYRELEVCDLDYLIEKLGRAKAA